LEEETLRADELPAIEVRLDEGALLPVEATGCECGIEADAEIWASLARFFDPGAALAEVTKVFSNPHSPTSS